MSNVQQPEMRRSGHDPLVTDSAKERVTRGGAPSGSAPAKDTRPAEQRSQYGPEGTEPGRGSGVATQAYLHGGPLDGQQRTVPIADAGEPEQQIEFDHQADETRWYLQYRRSHRRDDAGWHYEYTGNQEKPNSS